MSHATAKICGLTTPEAVAAALERGASHLGFVLFDKSPRAIGAEAAARLAQPVRGRARIVALLVDPDDALLANTVRVLAPDMIQLHGAESPSRAAEIRRITGLDTIKAVGVRDASDVRAALAYDGAADHLMFDAKPPKDAERPGGHGAPFDWTLLDGVKPQRPWFLAGGLDPWNVGEALRLSRAPLVDVSSGVERGPGLKDLSLIAAFLDAVRRA
ncbi:MAG TPA: phosphoribosylanthranilate isomerase [Caulobacteraceae bacterium]|nr:phosphoribosylanthranilate isomerase [Caulobacteraceae bacterium]